jgi:hypothetical protein
MTNYRQVFACIKTTWKEASYGFRQPDPRSPYQLTPELKPWQLPALVIHTSSFRLSFPSPLHVPRLRLLKSYIERYPDFHNLLSFVYLLYYTTRFTKPGTLGIAFHVLTWFLGYSKAPLHWDAQNRHISSSTPKSKSTTALNGEVASVISQQEGPRRRILQDLINVAVTPKEAINFKTDHDLVSVGYREYRLLCEYLRYAFDSVHYDQSC